MNAPPQNPLGKREKLFDSNFALLFQGQLVSRLGTEAFNIAMMLWVAAKTESATITSLIFVASKLPSIVLGPFAGTLADRRSRRNILILCDLISGFSVLSLAAAFMIMPERTDVLLGWLLGTSLMVGLSSAFFRPAVTAFIPDLAPLSKIDAANGFIKGGAHLAMVFGQAVGGIAFRVLGAPVLFLVDGISYLVSAVGEMFIREPDKARIPTESESFLEATAAGFSFLWQEKSLRSLFIIIAVLNISLQPFIILLPFHVSNALSAAPDWFGYLAAATGLGGLCGFVLAGIIKPGSRMGAITLAMIAMTTGQILIGRIASPGAALGAFALVGASIAVITVWGTSLIQTRTDADKRGRVLGMLGTVTNGVTPLAMAAAGIIHDLAGGDTGWVFTVTGATALVLCLPVMLVATWKGSRDR